MSELIREEQYNEPEGFVCDNDQKACWIMDKIREARADRDRMVEWYEKAIQTVKEQTEYNTANLERLLFAYFQTVPHKSTKTMESYSFPGGKLVLKKQNPEFVRDDKKVIAWLKENGGEQYVKVEEKLDWAGLKAATAIVDGRIANEDGEYIPGVEVINREAKFVVE